MTEIKRKRLRRNDASPDAAEPETVVDASLNTNMRMPSSDFYGSLADQLLKPTKVAPKLAYQQYQARPDNLARQQITSRDKYPAPKQVAYHKHHKEVPVQSKKRTAD